MILSFNYAGLKNAFPYIAEKIPPEIAEDPCYLFRIDTCSGLAEVGYADDHWILK